MDIEVIQHHRNKAETIIGSTLRANGVQPTASLIEEFLSFYDYNGLAATINNIYYYSKTVVDARREEPYFKLQLMTHC
jgi:hypothetical protein